LCGLAGQVVEDKRPHDELPCDGRAADLTLRIREEVDVIGEGRL